MSKPQSPGGRIVIKSVAWYTVATFSTKALAFLTIPVFTRILSPEEFGQFNVFAAIQALLLIVIGLESHLTLNRARFDFSGVQFTSYQFTLSLVSFALAATCGVPVLVWPEFVEGIFGLDASYLMVMVAFLMFQPAFRMFLAYQRVLYRYRVSASLTIGLTALSVVASVALVFVLQDSVMGRIVGAYMPYIVVGAFFFGYYVLKGGRFGWRFVKYSIPLSVPLIAATLGNEGMLVGSRIVVQQVSGAKDAALVALATSIASIALLLTMALNNAWAPWVMDMIEGGRSFLVTRAFRVLLLGIACLAGVVSLLGPEFVLFMGGDAYLPTVWLLPSLMLAVVLNLVVAQYILVETYRKNVWLGGLVTFCGALLNAVVCVFAVTAWDFWAVGYVSAGCYFVLIVAHKCIIRGFGYGDPFVASSLAPGGTVALLVVPVSLVLFGFPELSWVRFALVAVTIVFFALTIGRTVLTVRSRGVANS